MPPAFRCHVMIPPAEQLNADRRRSRRYDVFGCPARIGWWENTHFGTVIALLKDVSRGGVSALAESAPAPGTPVWLNLLAGPSDFWVEADLVESSPNRSFRHVPQLLRMKLVEPCPDPFYQAAIRGFHLATKSLFRNRHATTRKVGPHLRSSAIVDVR